MSIDRIQMRIKFKPIIRYCESAKDILGKQTINIDDKKKLIKLGRHVHLGLQRLGFDLSRINDAKAIEFKEQIIERSINFDYKIDQNLANSGMNKMVLENAELYFIIVSTLVEEDLS